MIDSLAVLTNIQLPFVQQNTTAPMDGKRASNFAKYARIDLNVYASYVCSLLYAHVEFSASKLLTSLVVVLQLGGVYVLMVIICVDIIIYYF